MIHQVLKATIDNPIKNDFVQTCQKYLDYLNIDLTFEQIAKMSKWKMKKLVNEKVSKAGFRYLLEKTTKQNISHIKYEELTLQEYLLDGNKNVKVAKFIFKARSMTLDIKMQKKWKFSDTICVGCGVNDETGEEIISCSGYGDTSDLGSKLLLYSAFYYGTTSEMAIVA